MNRQIFTIITGIITSINMISQEVSKDGIKCDLETIKKLRVHKDSITDNMILDFLLSIDISCKNNVEWTEASNWSLFWLADIETKRFINILKSYKNNIDVKLIIDEFKQPVNDSIELIAIHKKISELNDSDTIVLKILESIRSAAKELGIEIK